MVVGTYFLTEDEIKLVEVHRAIKKHGFGLYEVIMSEVREEFKTRVLIKAGKSWVFFLAKEMPEFNHKEIL